MSEQSEATRPDLDGLDVLLADYFGWVDRGHPPDVDAFLAATGSRFHDPQLAASLRHYIESTRSIEDLASFMTSHWVDPEQLERRRDPGDDPAGAPVQRRNLPAEFGDYELLEEIGRGGMGIVYRARHKKLDRIVCIKMILTGRLAGRREIERFGVEAQAMARLRHPNLVTVYEAGRLEEHDYFSMEYIPGPTLADRLRKGPLGAVAAARYLRAVARAIDYAHGAGLLHRDLKPSNILIDEFDQPRVADFGLARQIDAGSLTHTGMVLGTPGYMSPEQTQGHLGRLDARSDVYGLGAVLYELLTGRPPFRGDTPLDTLLQVRQAEPVALSLLNPRVPQDLETICLKCLDKQPARRYASAAALADELDRFLNHEPIQARPISPPQRFYRWCCRNPLWFGLGVTVMLGLVTIAGIAAFAYHTTAAALADAEAARDTEARLADELRSERDVAQSHLYLSQIHRANQAIEDGDLLEAAELLQRHLPGSAEKDRRGWEWYYLQASLAQYERSLDAHTGNVHAVAWSSDGRRLASVGEDEVLRVWDASTDEEIRSIQLPGGNPLDVDWSPAGDRVATAALDGVARIWDASDGSLIHELRSPGSGARCVSWSPRGDRLAAGGDGGEITIWSGTEGTPDRTLSRHAERVNVIRWTASGRWIASASDDGTIRIWDAADGTSAAVLNGQRDAWVNSLAWSADDRRLAAVTEDGVLRVWSVRGDQQSGEVRTEELYARTTSSRKPLLSVVWSESDRFLVTGGVLPRMTMWDPETGEPLQMLRGHVGLVRRLTRQPGGQRIASASADGTVKFWGLDVDHGGTPIHRGDSPVRTAAWSADGRWIAWRDIEGRVVVWDTVSHRVALEFAESPLGATGLAWHPKQSQLAFSRSDSVIVFEVPDGREVLRLEGHEGPIWMVAWDPGGHRLATASNDHRVILWDGQTGESLHTFAEHPGDVRCLAWSHDGSKLAAVATDSVVRVWDAASGSLQRTLAGETTAINDLAWSGDGTWIAAAGQEGSILRWDIQTGRAMPSLVGHQGAVWRVVPGREGTRLFSCGQDGTARVWDLTTDQEILQMTGHDGAVWSLGLSPDTCCLVTSGVDHTIRVWRSIPRLDDET